MKISRKNFLKFGMFSGIGFALPDWATKLALKPREDTPPPLYNETFAYTVCALCPAGCGIRVRKVDGSAVGSSGIPGHPVNQGSLCPKGAAALQELYHPDRIRGPLVREGERGSGKWKKVTWQEAFEILSKNMGRSGTGSRKLPFAAITQSRAWDIQSESLRKLAISLGRNNFFTMGFSLSDPPFDAYKKMHGLSRVGFDLTRAKIVVSFGFDWLQSYSSPIEAQMAFAQLRQGMTKGRAEIVQIEPRLSVTAGKSDTWIRVYPGTEGILALAVAKQIIDNGTYDKSFVNSHCQGFEDFKNSLERYSLDKVSAVTGTTPKEILMLADRLSSLKPSSVITNRGPLLTQLSVHALNALLGNLSKSGVFFDMKNRDNFQLGVSAFEDLTAHPPQALLIDRVNPLFLSPLEWKGIFSKIPFVATVSPFLTETAEFSDLVLPCHTPLERGHCSSHVLTDGSMVLNVSAKAVEPLYDTKNPGEIFLLIARAFARTDLPDDYNSYFMGHIKRLQVEKLLDENSGKIWQEISGPAVTSPRFGTKSGKFEFNVLTSLLRQTDIMKQTKNNEFPLYVYFYSPLAFSFGEGAHLPYLQSIAGSGMQEAWETWAEIHPDTAKIYRISDGDIIWVESQRGKIKVRSKLEPSAMTGVISLPVGLGHTAYGRWATHAGYNPMEIGIRESHVKIWKI